MEAIQEFVSYLDHHELSYVVLIVLLFIFPRILGKFGLPLGMGAFLMGFVSATGLDLFSGEEVIPTFAILGISSLFLFAGLEINFQELKNHARLLIQHMIVSMIVISTLVFLSERFLGLSFRISALLALALFTPSTGYILDMLPGSKIAVGQKLQVKLMAISAEIVALAMLVLVQSSSPANVALSIGAIALLSITMPFLFQWVAKRVSIRSPGADFSFLLLLAVAVGTITKKMGAYYLVGAFLVGITVNYYERHIAKASNLEFEQAAKFFAAFFMPFYFFNAGMKVDPNMFSLDSIGMAAIFVLVSFPIRIGTVMLHRKVSTKENYKQSLPIALSLMPTLVFGLIMIEILRGANELPPEFIGGVLIYTLFTTLTPPIILTWILKRPELADVASSENLSDYDSIPGRT
jgi:Kef-type K+ transport system membrane component KefB